MSKIASAQEETKENEKPADTDNAEAKEEGAEQPVEETPKENEDMSESAKEQPEGAAANTETEMVDATETVTKDERRRVMFETDDYEKALRQVLWFGQKVP